MTRSADLLRFNTCGSVDDGKSTLIGRLLYDSKSLMEDQIEALERSADITGAGQINLANLTDGLRAEREQGITIDVAYRYFDGYPLLALGAEAVREVGEVYLPGAGYIRGTFERFDLVLHERLRIIEEASYESRFAVVNGAACVEAEKIGGARHGQKYPAFLRSSIAASETLSYAREPCSVTRATAISEMMSATLLAGDSTQPVLMTAPMVRTRTTRSSTRSPGFGGASSLTGSHWPCRRTTRRRWLK